MCVVPLYRVAMGEYLFVVQFCGPYSFHLCVGLRKPVSHGLYEWHAYPVVFGSFYFTPGIDYSNGFLLLVIIHLLVCVTTVKF